MCGCTTTSGYLRSHIRFNHLINKEFLVDKMYGMHYPTLCSSATQTDISWVRKQRSGLLDPGGNGDLVTAQDEAEQRVEDVGGGGQEEVRDSGGQGGDHVGEDSDGGAEEGPGDVEDSPGEPEDEVLCPACGDVEDGTAMIACELCDRLVKMLRNNLFIK